MNNTSDAMAHYSAALQAIDAMGALVQHHPDPRLLELLASAREHFENGFWQAHLNVLSNVREVSATPYSRRIPLTSVQSRHLDLLRAGMLEAQNSLAPDNLATPWTSLFNARQQVPVGKKRTCFEAGYLIRFFQLLQEARHGVPQWTLRTHSITPGERTYRYRP
ncbi:hypothetical protein [Pseudomonas multiresinivorans]|uniref:Uncharacterized protein n=1 Tax=Pseudomonas multiresinivorans TaxID=95301 RepID=A0A7Z3GR22_9PSED|nr:hypothetical protein [Pseudomonas multiresinivorans]QJP09810.1 hypothetical protein G4G71_18670 [Pseudomonas multiresinivorans]